MRKIIFRGKLSHNGRWITGNLIYNQDMKPYIIPFDVLEADGHHLRIDSDKPYWVKPETISQFSGFYDINHEMIFENDIVQDREDYILKIIYDNGFCAKWIGEDELEYDIDSLKVKKIGNVFDNSDLL